jgi:hypothetical protein
VTLPAGPATGAGLEPQHLPAVDARARALDASPGVAREPQELAARRADRSTLALSILGPAPVTEIGVLAADPAAATNTLTEPHSGGIERPRTAVAAARVVFAGLVADTGVVSMSNKSLGVQSNAVHNAANVDNFTCDGCLVINADTDAADSCNPARSDNNRRRSAPVHTSRCAAAMRSFH